MYVKRVVFRVFIMSHCLYCLYSAIIVSTCATYFDVWVFSKPCLRLRNRLEMPVYLEICALFECKICAKYAEYMPIFTQIPHSSSKTPLCGKLCHIMLIFPKYATDTARARSETYGIYPVYTMKLARRAGSTSARRALDELAWWAGYLVIWMV